MLLSATHSTDMTLQGGLNRLLLDIGAQLCSQCRIIDDAKSSHVPSLQNCIGGAYEIALAELQKTNPARIRLQYTYLHAY